MTVERVKYIKLETKGLSGMTFQTYLLDMENEKLLVLHPAKNEFVPCAGSFEAITVEEFEEGGD